MDAQSRSPATGERPALPAAATPDESTSTDTWTRGGHPGAAPASGTAESAVRSTDYTVQVIENATSCAGHSLSEPEPELESLTLACQLCAKERRNAESNGTISAADAAPKWKKRREPQEYASYGRLAMHVKAVHEGSHIVDAVVAQAATAHKPATVVEDGGLLVCVKPAGIDTRDFGHTDSMILLALQNGLSIPRPVHRLDAATAGCLVMGRTKAAVAAMSKSFKERLVQKQYCAIVCGAFPRELGRSGTLDSPLSGKPCVTHFTVLQEDPSVSHGTVTTVRLEPHTGRTHQLRRHMAAIGCPIVGDPSYQPRVSLRVREAGLSPPPLLLWAAKVSLPHPDRPEVIEADAGPEPPTFQAYRFAEMHR